MQNRKRGARPPQQRLPRLPRLARLLSQLSLLACCAIPPAAAAEPAAPVVVLNRRPQTLEVQDGVAVDALISAREPTRIRVDGARIQDVLGNVYSSSCTRASDANALASAGAVNPGGEFVLGCDAAKGEIYVRPVAAAGPPFSLFVTTEHGTYTLRLQRADIAAGTIILHDRGHRQREPAAGRAPDYVRALKFMLLAMAAPQAPAEVALRNEDRPVTLWQDSRLVLRRSAEGYGLLGEQYQLTNLGGAPMVLAEQEFDRPGVLAVALDALTLAPGESTWVYVILEGGQP